MIIYKRKKKQLIIPCGLGPVVCEDSNYELEMKQVDSSTVLQQVEPDEGYYGLYRVIVNPYTVEWKNRPITGNGTYVITPENADALSGVEISVDVQANLQEKTVDSSTVGQVVSPDNDYDGLSRVNVNPYTLESKSQVITVNGEYTVTPSGADGLSSVDISVNVADIPAVLQEKTVDSSTENQAITPDEGYDGLSQVNVNPYTLESKSDIITDNGMYTYYPNTADGLDRVTIDVSVDTVNNQSKTVDSSTEMQYVQPDQGYTGLDYVAVNPYTLDSKTVDSSTVSQTIVSDEDGLSSVTVNPYTLESKSDTLTANGQYVYTADNADALSQVSIDVSINTVNNQSKTADSSTVSQAITPDQGYTGLDSVTINPYTLDSKTVNSSTSQQVITSDEDGLSSVTVNPYTLESKSDTLTANGQYTYTADNADALSEVTIDVSINTVNNQSKTVDSSTVSQAITPDSGYTGLDSVTVNPYVLDNKTVNPSTNVQVVTSDEDGLASVTVNAIIPSTLTANSSTNPQEFRPIFPNQWFNDVIVNPYTTESDSSVLTHNGQYVFTPENADALSQVTVDVSINTVNNQAKTADSSTVSQNITPDNGYTGLDSVTINPYVLDSKTVDSSTVSQTVTSDVDGLSSVTVNPYVINNQDKELTVSGYYHDLDSSITADTGYDGLNSVKINAPHLGYMIVQAFGKGGYTMNVNRYIPKIDVRDLSLQSKTLSSWGPGTDASILPDDGYDGFTDIKILDQYSALRVKPLSVELGWDSSHNTHTIPSYHWFLPKKNVTSILLDYVLLQSNKTVDASTVSQTVTFDEWDSSLLNAYDASADPENLWIRYQGLKQVTVNPYTVESKSDTLTANGHYTYTPTGADALSEVTIDVSINTAPTLQSKTVNSSTSSQIVHADQNYDGLSQVVINPYTLDSKTVNSSTSQQVITSDEDGLSQVTVNPYTVESKSGNITTNGHYTYSPTNADALSSVNIDVSINTVNNQAKTTDSSTVSQNITPDNGYTGLSSVTVNPYVLDSKTVNSSTLQQVITSDEDGLSSVTVNPYVLDSKTVDSSTVSQTIVSDEDGLSSVTINPYTVEDDSSVLTTNGHYEFAPTNADALSKVVVDVSINTVNNQAKTANSSTVSQAITPDNGYTGLSQVTINPYTTETETDTITANGRYEYTPQNADALSSVVVDVSVQGQVINNQSKTVDSSTVGQTVAPDYNLGYTGLGKVDVNPYVLDSSTVNPSTNTIIVTSTVDGLSSVTVNAVNHAIDSNITAGNIREGVEILGVEGTYAGTNQSKTVDSSTASQDITPDNGYTGLSKVTVNPYVLDSKTVDCSTGQQVITSDVDGLSSVTVNAAKLQGRSYTPQRGDNTIYPNASNGYIGFSKVTIYGVTAAIDSDIQPENIKQGIEILGVTGSYTGNNQSKTVDSSTVSQTVSPDSGYTGLSSVTVNPYSLQFKVVNPYRYASQQIDYTADNGYNGLSTVRIGYPSSSICYANPSVNTIYYNPGNESKDYFDTVCVYGVTSSIDSNIQAGNIKSGVSILGVTGSYVGQDPDYDTIYNALIQI